MTLVEISKELDKEILHLEAQGFNVYYLLKANAAIIQFHNLQVALAPEIGIEE